MTSVRKSMSNRKNAASSSGPKTARGKAVSSQNARKLGLFSQELTFAGTERTEFEEIRDKFWALLQPGEVIPLQLCADRIVVLEWRLKFALRLEQRELAQRMAESTGSQQSVPPRLLPRYRELVQKGKLLDELQELGRRPIPPELRDALQQSFHPEFIRMVSSGPEEGSDTAVSMAAMMAVKSARFKMDLPGQPSTQELDTARESLAAAHLHTRIKLIQSERLHLQEMSEHIENITNAAGGHAVDRLETYAGYQTRINRELAREYSQFFWLKGKFSKSRL